MEYIVRPKEYHRGYCPTICDTMESAEEQLALMQKYTDFEWVIETDDEDEDEGEPEYVLKTEACSQIYDTYEKAREGFSIHHEYYIREGWELVCMHQSKRAITVDGSDVRAMRGVYRKNGKTEEVCLSVRIEID